ncbi:MAG: hypothetical protein D6737_14450 [Chloroflexi bacterium]|nr:MAG: hypothetical protein D6737_14450 [Chloroflexota bacterium]
MPNEITWYIKNHIIYVRNFGELTNEDWQRADGILIDMIREGAAAGSALVHIIVDMADVTAFPKQVQGKGGRVFQHKHEPALGWTMIAGRDDPEVQFIATITTQANNSQARLRVFATVNEALSYLRDVDSHLPSEFPTLAREDLEALKNPKRR